MKFTVELEEFWLEDGGDIEYIESELKREIIREVTSKIRESLSEKVNEEIYEKVKEFTISRMSVVINEEIAKCIETGVIESRRTGTKKEISINEHVKEMFVSNSGWGSADHYISKIAKEFGEELKLQYNNVYANKIVQNMKEQGFLKDDVAQMLLGSGK